MELDLDFVRAQFPAFSDPELAEQAFFDNAAGSYACGFVVDRLTRFYRERKVQPYGHFEASRLGGEEMEEAHMRLAAMLGVARDELSFGPSTTQNAYVLSHAFQEWLRPGDAVIVTDQDHEANSGPWRRLAAAGVEIREWTLDPQTGHLDPRALDQLLDDKVKLVCFPHCSNVIGEINPVAEIAAKVRDAGAFSCVDGVSYAPHGLPDVGALGADIYLFSTYKTYGPHQGLMVVRRALGELLPNQGHFFNGDTLYKRFTPAGPDHAQIASCAGIADYFDALHAHHFDSSVDTVAKSAQVHDLMRAQEIKLAKPLLDYLSARNDVRLIGPSDAATRAPTVTIEALARGDDLARELAALGVNASGGDFYAVRALEAMNVPREKGALRLSFVHYTSQNDVERLIKALDQVL